MCHTVIRAGEPTQVAAVVRLEDRACERDKKHRFVIVNGYVVRSEKPMKQG